MGRLNKSFFGDEADNQGIRINKYLSDSGLCSRREADKHVELGHVTIDGIAAVMGSKVLPGQKVMFCGKPVEKDDKMVLIAFNEPRGIVCTTDLREPDNIIEFINYPSRIYPIGRLDKDSEGLILLTNNGMIVNKILRAGNNHEKEYIVTVNKPITTEFLKGMASGVPILDTITKPCDIEAMDRSTFRITLTQGLNRQIRRMCEYFEYRVLSLQRIRVMNVNLGRLQLGGYRNLTEWELEELNELLKNSSNAPGSGAVQNSKDYDEEFVDCDEYEKANGKYKDAAEESTRGRVTYAKGTKKHMRSAKKPYEKSENKPYMKSDKKPYEKTENKPHMKSDRKTYEKPENKPHMKSDRKPYEKSENKLYVKSDRKPYMQQEDRLYIKSADKLYVQSEGKSKGFDTRYDIKTGGYMPKSIVKSSKATAKSSYGADRKAGAYKVSDGRGYKRTEFNNENGRKAFKNQRTGRNFK